MVFWLSIHSREVRNYDEAAIFIEALAEDVHANGLPFGTFLNVNIPNRPLKEIAGIRISRLDMDFFPEFIDKRMDLLLAGMRFLARGQVNRY